MPEHNEPLFDFTAAIADLATLLGARAPGRTTPRPATS